jgi:hypothetical protein
LILPYQSSVAGHFEFQARVFFNAFGMSQLPSAYLRPGYALSGNSLLSYVRSASLRASLRRKEKGSFVSLPRTYETGARKTRAHLSRRDGAILIRPLPGTGSSVLLSPLSLNYITAFLELLYRWSVP